MKEQVEANRRRWDELVPIHAGSRFYDVEGFRAGRSTLLPVELEEVGDVTGKSLLHLQCHFGLDTLSWARLGADVTGVDFSVEAISLARRIAKENGIKADFIEADVYDLPSMLKKKFDIVFTSYGVLCWLPDLGRWSKIASSLLKDEGFLYIVEDHPMASIADEGSRDRMCMAQPYFTDGKATRFEVQGTYTDRRASVENATTYEWTHTFSDIVNAIIRTGLRIEFIHEFPFGFFPRFQNMQRKEDGTYHFKDERMNYPLMFSLKAWKR